MEKENVSQAKFRTKFCQILKKLDQTCQLKSRIVAIKDLDQLIVKKNHKLQKKMIQQQQQWSNNSGFNSTSSSGFNNGQGAKYEFPYCLSIVILKIQDLILNPGLKKDYRGEVEALVMRCFMQQRCLVYKFPNLMLYIMESFPEPQVKLNYLQMLTNNALEIDSSFNSQLFIILLKLIDTNSKPSIADVLSFIKNIFDFNPRAFTEAQTLSLLLRVSLVGIESLNSQNKQEENSMEVCEILQYYLKYNNYSPKVLNISLLTMCILSNKEPLTQLVWNLLKTMIMTGPDYIFQEMVEILQIISNSQIFDKNPQTKLVSSSLGGTPLSKEIRFKCFKESNFSYAVEIDDLQESFSITRCSIDKRQSPNHKMTFFELVCRNNCSSKFLEINQEDEILRLESKAQNAFDKGKCTELVSLMQNDRKDWIMTFEKNIDRVLKGAIFFIGKVLWSHERIEEIKYPISQILKFFSQLIKQTQKFSVLNEILTAIKVLVLNKDVPLFFEWETILQIIDQLSFHVNLLMEKKNRIDNVYEIFKVIKFLILVGKFPEDTEGYFYQVYLKFKNAKAIQDKTITQLAIDYCFKNDFLGQFQFLLESCLINEKNGELRSLFLDTVHDFYQENEDPSVTTILEAVFANNLEYFYLTRKDGSFSTPQIIQIIDILTLMAYKTTKSTNFRHITQILSECINCFEFDRSSLNQDLQMNAQTNFHKVKQSLINKGVISSVYQDQIKMKSFQTHALNRLIQLFIIKAQTPEFEKSIYVYNLLLHTVKFSSNDRRQIICTELLEKLQVNAYRELCWKTTDNPLFIEIQKYHEPQIVEDNVDPLIRQSSDSQGNSSAEGSNHSGSSSLQRQNTQPRYRDSIIINATRSSLNKLLEEKYMIQNTLRALIACLEDMTTSQEVKKSCLKLFHKFVIFISEEDFQNFEVQDSTDINYGKFITIENKNEWQKMILTLIRMYEPMVEPEFDFIILDIFYAILGLQNYQSSYPLLSKELHYMLLEQFMKTLQTISNYLWQRNLMRDQIDVTASHFQGTSASDFRRNFSTVKMSNAQNVRQSNAQVKIHKSQKSLNQNELSQMQTSNMAIEIDIVFKNAVKMAKKTISLIGFCFLMDTNDNGRIWYESTNEAMRNSQNMESQQKVQTDDFKLIEYLMDQLMVLTLNDQILPKIGIQLLICIQNILCATKKQKNLLLNPLLIDYLMFLNTRIAFPYLLNKAELIDPMNRIRLQLHRINKNLRDLYREYFCSFSPEDKFYLSCIMQNQTQQNLKEHLILNNTAKVISLQCKDETVQVIITLLGQNEIITLYEKQLEQQKIQRSIEIKKRERRLKGFIDCLSSTILWLSHGVYDRNTDSTLEIEFKKKNGVHHFVWNRNMITITQNQNKYDVIVRSPSYNFRSKVEIRNRLQQFSEGNSNQITGIKRLLDQNYEIKEENKMIDDLQEEEINLASIIYNDNTLMSLIEPNSLINFKKSKDLLTLEDENVVRNNIQLLDSIPPKDQFIFGIYYVPKNTARDLKSLNELQIQHKKVSEDHLFFLSMIGKLCSKKDKQLHNYNLYLREIFDSQSENTSLIINEDDSTFIAFVSNVLNDPEVSNNVLIKVTGQVVIIYNESNISDFSRFDPTKIFLVFSKLNNYQYLYELQQMRNVLDIQKTMRLSKVKSEQYFQFDESLLTANKLAALQSQQQQLPLNNQSYTNGHLSSIAVIQKERIGDWVKQICTLSEMFERKHRFGPEEVTSNIIQRCLKIKKIKDNFIKSSKLATILKT